MAASLMSTASILILVVQRHRVIVWNTSAIPTTSREEWGTPALSPPLPGRSGVQRYPHHFPGGVGNTSAIPTTSPAEWGTPAQSPPLLRRSGEHQRCPHHLQEEVGMDISSRNESLMALAFVTPIFGIEEYT